MVAQKSMSCGRKAEGWHGAARRLWLLYMGTEKSKSPVYVLGGSSWGWRQGKADENLSEKNKIPISLRGSQSKRCQKIQKHSCLPFVFAKSNRKLKEQKR